MISVEVRIPDQELGLSDFEYELPERLIATQPAPRREKSRLLVVDRKSESLTHRVFEDLPDLLNPSDVLVVNNTKVIPARLEAFKANGAQVELLLLKPIATKIGCWEAMAAPLRKLKVQEELVVGSKNNPFPIQILEFCCSPDGQKRVVVDLGSNAVSILSEAGYAPLPPYIRKQRVGEDRNRDLERYQTIFAQVSGAVAAPTAGLHFSEGLMKKLRACGIDVRQITLHVGPGTFKPIVTSVRDHKVEPETYSIDPETANAINHAVAEGRRVIAVGTTSCRALESSWRENILMSAEDAQTDLYIRPGFEFKVTGGLITNFHLSRSSLLVMVAAFAEHDLIMRAYTEAIEQGYRFYSYGDAMLIL